MRIDKSIPGEWRSEFDGKMVFVRFLRDAEESTVKKRGDSPAEMAQKSIRESRTSWREVFTRKFH